MNASPPNDGPHDGPDAFPVALITGGTRGIGRAICTALASTHHLLVGGRDAERVASVVNELPSAEAFVCDLNDEASTAAAASAVGRLDALVHSAGVIGPGRVSELTRAQWRAVLETNVVAVADLTRLLMPALRAAHGQIVLINSGAGFSAGANGGLYSASKFGLRAFGDALREEERGTVRVTSIHPGRVDTEMQQELQRGNGPYVPEQHLRAQSVADAVAFALAASPEAMIESLSIRPVYKG